MTKISKKKPVYKVNDELWSYLNQNERHVRLPIKYNDLTYHYESFPLLDKNGSDTLWESVVYNSSEVADLYKRITKTYALLKTDGDLTVMEHLEVDRIDYCTFGNSNPFRVRIVNTFNDNYDYFYVKKVDASRIFGLELEHILSPNRINFFVDENTLIEEHIAGIPGHDFIDKYLFREETNKVRIAKEFIKFNERCFARLLGDMRSYNYVVDVTPDFEDAQYRVRAIDFDQQSYEGKRTMYFPQFFKENKKVVELTLSLINKETILQYQLEERTLIAKRLKAEAVQMSQLLHSMKSSELSTPTKLAQLKRELNIQYRSKDFSKCTSMGAVVEMNLRKMLLDHD